MIHIGHAPTDGSETGFNRQLSRATWSESACGIPGSGAAQRCQRADVGVPWRNSKAGVSEARVVFGAGVAAPVRSRLVLVRNREAMTAGAGDVSVAARQPSNSGAHAMRPTVPAVKGQSDG